MNFEAARELMVEEQLRGRGIRDERVLMAMRKIPRHLFVAATVRDRAYEDSPLPIDAEQTISQPYIVALMVEILELRGQEKVLEIGTGSGYQTAILAELAAEVYSIERIPALAEQAKTRLRDLGYGERVHIRVGDGGQGWMEEAPFDGIVVAAATREVPRPLVEQLSPTGALVLPLGELDLQGLARIRRGKQGLQVDYFGECRFVKLVGPYGWEE
jgi:protein-L-isoaspartate(D-aspartate) O-methyltransferase